MPELDPCEIAGLVVLGSMAYIAVAAAFYAVIDSVDPGWWNSWSMTDDYGRELVVAFWPLTAVAIVILFGVVALWDGTVRLSRSLLRSWDGVE